MKPKKSGSGSTWLFHRPGRKPIAGKIKETGESWGGRTYGRSKRVVVTIQRKGKIRQVTFAEKMLPEIYGSIKPRSVFILNELRKLGLSVIPTARLALKEGATDPGTRERTAKQIMTDLTKGGKFKVVDYEGFSDMMPEVARLSNLNEIKAQIQREEQIAVEHGFRFEGREWLVVIDPETNTGKPYIVDVKATEMSKRRESKCNAWLDKMGVY